jgi:hypothetical protein
MFIPEPSLVFGILTKYFPDCQNLGPLHFTSISVHMCALQCFRMSATSFTMFHSFISMRANFLKLNFFKQNIPLYLGVL